MPLWLIFHPTGTFGDIASKQALAKDITKIYTEIGLPAFYVVVNFIELETANVWVGGEQKSDKPFFRIAIEHIAFHVEKNHDVYDRTTARIDKALKPHIADEGYEWEFHVDETERRLWKVNGLIPPSFSSEQERIWARENRAVPYDDSSVE